MVNPTKFILFFCFFLLTGHLCTPAAAAARFVGGRRPVENVKDNREIQELGRYCVRQYNHQQQQQQQHLPSHNSVQLVFSEVVAAETQVVAGIKYYLKIAAATHGGGGPTRTFEAVVVVKPWVHSKELLDFAPSTPTPSYTLYSSK